jgi:GMP synthase-like glutamine amidotransferase
VKAHVLQHVPFEDIGSMAGWLKSHQADISYTRLYANESLPPIDNLDCIIIMGGPMSVNDEASLPWLRPEKDFICEVLKHRIPTLGICLGAQLIASALQSRVYPNTHKEIGWFPVSSVFSGKDTFRFPEQFTAFHWHGETFDLPENSLLLAKSEGCTHQAFQIGDYAVGLQFHIETTPESLESLIENCYNELQPGLYIQTEQKMRQIPASGYAVINRQMDRLLSYITQIPN